MNSTRTNIGTTPSTSSDPFPNNNEQRKSDHIRINLEEDVSFRTLTNGLENFFFMHQALPEINLAEVDTSTSLFGKTLKTPLLISSMTGGTAEARSINRILAEAAQEAGLAMGLGSMRAAIEDESLADSYRVRDLALDIPTDLDVGFPLDLAFESGVGADHGVD